MSRLRFQLPFLRFYTLNRLIYALRIISRCALPCKCKGYVYNRAPNAIPFLAVYSVAVVVVGAVGSWLLMHSAGQNNALSPWFQWLVYSVLSDLLLWTCFNKGFYAGTEPGVASFYFVLLCMLKIQMLAHNLYAFETIIYSLIWNLGFLVKHVANLNLHRQKGHTRLEHLVRLIIIGTQAAHEARRYLQIQMLFILIWIHLSRIWLTKVSHFLVWKHDSH